MRTIAVVHSRHDWPVAIPGVEVVSARDYLIDPNWTKERGVRVFNLCRTYSYQSEGYYVSLLAAGRRHRPFPDLKTVLDMKSRHRVRTVDEELDELINKSLADIHQEKFQLSIYFGRNLARRHDRLANKLFTQFPVPLLRAQFQRLDRWHMTSITPIAMREVPEAHRDFVAASAAAHVGSKKRPARRVPGARYDLAILWDPNEQLAPSDKRALARFRRAARLVGFDVEMIEREDYSRVAEFDALFIRETTAVDHHTFRFAQRAESEGLVVIDDPTSILRCTNKVYQAEALELAGVPIPRTVILDAAGGKELDAMIARIGLPCVLKHPDSAFSQGVAKCSTRDEVVARAAAILEESDLLVAQEFMPTDFDWRIGVFAGEVLYAARYLMASGHWQIVKQTGAGKFSHGRVEPVALDQVPKAVVDIGLRAANVIGDGLYGVDIKVAGERIVVTEVNDNPNIDVGCEDAILGRELYERIMRGMLDRVRSRKKERVK
ncbi:MAG: RimK family protein [Planctomycetota bacterium]